MGWEHLNCCAEAMDARNQIAACFLDDWLNLSICLCMCVVVEQLLYAYCSTGGECLNLFITCILYSHSFSRDLLWRIKKAMISEKMVLGLGKCESNRIDWKKIKLQFHYNKRGCTSIVQCCDMSRTASVIILHYTCMQRWQLQPVWRRLTWHWVGSTICFALAGAVTCLGIRYMYDVYSYS